VRRGRIEDVLDVGWSQTAYGLRPDDPATLFWPEDRAWFVAADPDLDSTYVGGSAALVDELLAADGIEVVEVFPGDGIGLWSDEVNIVASDTGP
jgi:hypothetical protein